VKKLLLISVLCLLLVAVIATPVSASSYRMLTKGIGTVHFVDIEGGCWTIQAKHCLYEVPNLPPLYQVEGLRVVFWGVKMDCSIFMIGIPLYLIYVWSPPPL
jgi:hypothetical protein